MRRATFLLTAAAAGVFAGTVIVTHLQQLPGPVQNIIGIVAILAGFVAMAGGPRALVRAYADSFRTQWCDAPLPADGPCPFWSDQTHRCWQCSSDRAAHSCPCGARFVGRLQTADPVFRQGRR